MANLASLLVRGVSRLGQVFASTVKADSFIGTATKTEFIRGTQTAATGTWTGVTEDAELYDGKEILYFLPYAGSGNATLNLTLSGGTTTGAKNVYFQSTTRCTTHYGANALIRMTYHTALNIGGTNYEGWWTEPGRDTNTHYTSKLITGASATATANAAVTNNSIFLNLLDDSTVRNSHNIVGAGLVIVDSDANGKVTITGANPTSPTYQITLSSTGWSGTAPNLTQTISASGVTTGSVLKFGGIVYPANTTKANKKILDKAASNLVKFESGSNTIKVTACETVGTNLTLLFIER